MSDAKLIELFPDAEMARRYFEAMRWPNGPVCPACEESKRIGARRNGMYRCYNCTAEFSVRTGSIFERTKIPLNKWLYAMFYVATLKDGISSVDLAQRIGVSQKSAWFILQRLREVTRHDSENTE